MARASFLKNLIPVPKYVSAYQIDGGHTSSIFGIPSLIVSQKLINDHIARESTGAFERFMKAEAAKTGDTVFLTPRMKIMVLDQFTTTRTQSRSMLRNG